ncbi:hypothetical protein HDZ31DRAFT_69330 [Schizophyllum fasciatum]
MSPTCRCPILAAVSMAIPVRVDRAPPLPEEAPSPAPVPGPTSRSNGQSNHEATKVYLRRQLGLPEYAKVNLWALPDIPPNARPVQTLEMLAKLAIAGTRNGKATSKEICDAIAERFPFYQTPAAGAWRNSIKHELSRKSVFCLETCSDGKKVWHLDFSGGEGHSRPRKRGTRGYADDDDDDSD